MNTRPKFVLILKCLLVLPLLPLGMAEGAVLLTANTATVNVMPGDTFSLTLSLVGNGGEQITGVDYYWTISNVTGNLVGEISLTDRSIGASPFSDVYFSDAVVEASPGNLLDPQNDSDLGASLDNVNSPLSNSTWFLATFTFTVSPTASFGEVATLSTFNNPGEGWIGPGPTFPGGDYDSQAIITVNVVPEPSILLLVGTVLPAIFFCSRHRKPRCD